MNRHNEYDQETSELPSALAGVRVLDFSQMMMGPWGTQFLGDMVADVIKIERPDVGEWERSLTGMGELLVGESVFFIRQSADAAEGIRAFVEKRHPTFEVR